MTRILLVTAPFQQNLITNVDVGYLNYPLGIMYIYSVLEKEKHKVDFLNANNINEINYLFKLKEKIDEFKPKIVGFNILSSNRVSTFKSIENILSLYPKIKIILGGVHSSICYEQILRKYPKVIIVIGEGEETIKEIASGKDLDYIKGITYFKNGCYITNEKRELIQDLDSLPFPKHELYFSDKRTLAYMLTSRGCPYQCSFCCLHAISKRKYRTRSVNNVINEIEYIIKKFPQIKVIEFSDDTFLLDNNRAKLILKQIIKNKYNIKFRCSSRLKPIDKELVHLLEQAGFQEILFGLESGCSKLLSEMHKGITKEDVIESFNILKGSKISTPVFMIVGFKGENKDTIKETVVFLKQLKKIKHFWLLGVNRLMVYPGTEVWQQYKESKSLTNDFWLGESDIPYNTIEYTDDQLQDLANEVMLKSMRYWEFIGLLGSFVMIELKVKGYIVNRIKNERLIMPLIKKAVGVW